MGVVKHDPGVMMLTGVRMLAHIEPADAAGQHQDHSKRRRHHHLGDAPAGDPLQPHQQRELALDGSGQSQRVAQKLQQRPRRARLPFMGRSLAVWRGS